MIENPKTRGASVPVHVASSPNNLGTLHGRAFGMSTCGLNNDISLMTRAEHSLSKAQYGQDPPEEKREIPSTRFGVTIESNGTAGEVIHPSEPPLVSYFREKKEALYKREPVGHSSKHVKFVKEHHKGTLTFGVKTQYNESAKNVLYPIDQYEQNEMEKERNELYKISHQAWEAGEQINRNYDWENTPIKDPQRHRFGKTLPPEIDGAKQTLSNYYQPPTPQQLIHDEPVPTTSQFEGKTFGMRNKVDEWGSIDCIRGYNYGVDKYPDRGFTAPIIPGTEHMVFGVKSKQDLGAIAVLSNRVDIPERDKPLSKIELQEFVQDVVAQEGVEFDSVFQYATEKIGSDQLSINQFLNIFNSLYNS
ncbi:hypothetical protein FDP41_001328 [Naegleria fowleri]|uniref:Uncharacterized protein n=1 Tax=Naegleria fowleri TaxID=5763 RepID=A0A6A5C1B8_NAEFO|nr:uncharacterized protein FDP41_001328 [Naegleria fowleri]KAF0979660.1 hypothetical protein FDP41_001328 [Naegleria fowleri]